MGASSRDPQIALIASVNSCLNKVMLLDGVSRRIFQNINVLYELNRDCFNNKLLHALQPDNWAFSSAWEGMSYLGELSLEALQ